MTPLHDSEIDPVCRHLLKRAVQHGARMEALLRYSILIRSGLGALLGFRHSTASKMSRTVQSASAKRRYLVVPSFQAMERVGILWGIVSPDANIA